MYQKNIEKLFPLKVGTTDETVKWRMIGRVVPALREPVFWWVLDRHYDGSVTFRARLVPYEVLDSLWGSAVDERLPEDSVEINLQDCPALLDHISRLSVEVERISIRLVPPEGIVLDEDKISVFLSADGGDLEVHTDQPSSDLERWIMNLRNTVENRCWGDREAQTGANGSDECAGSTSVE
jgi:hypothetical protein